MNPLLNYNLNVSTPSGYWVEKQNNVKAAWLSGHPTNYNLDISTPSGYKVTNLHNVNAAYPQRYAA